MNAQWFALHIEYLEHTVHILDEVTPVAPTSKRCYCW